MGCTGSKSEDEIVQARQKSAQIDAQLRKDRVREVQEQKLLLLGAGESGKSTVFKQIKLIHGDGYSVKERLSFRDVIFSNVIQSIKTLLFAGDRLGFPLSPENKAVAERVLALQHSDDFNASVATDVALLWRDRAVQATIARSAQFQIQDTASYFLQQVERIGASDYTPSIQDVLHARLRTSGIREMPFSFGGLNFRLIDVGGQRTERRKWIHCFQGVTAVVFVSSLSEFDQVLMEDEQTNRMQESLLLFEEICNCKWFRDTSVILFLNKVDLFEEKLRRGADLRVCFPDYNGRDSTAAKEYITQRFVELNQSETKLIYPHITCATDTQNIKFVFEAVKDIILQINLRGSGLF